MAAESSMGKVVIRLTDGKVHPGFCRQEDVTDESVRIILRDGKEKHFSLKDIKGVFFVKDFKGDPEYQPVKFLGKQSGRSSVLVRIQFEDEEVIEGLVRDHMALLLSPGFYLWPTDENTNNGLIYIVKQAVKSFEILATE